MGKTVSCIPDFFENFQFPARQYMIAVTKVIKLTDFQFKDTVRFIDTQ